MKIRINVSEFLNENNIFMRILHIKAIRAQLNYGIGEAKAISDIVWDSAEAGVKPPYIVIETTQYPKLDFMLRDERVKNYIKKPNEVVTFLDKSAIDTPEVKLLKTTVNKLIKLNAFESAKLVIDILYDLNEASEDA